MHSPIPLYSDEELLAKYQATNNPEIVGELFKRHTLMCYTVCFKYLKDQDLANDAVMSIFEKLFLDLHKHAIQNFKSWLHSVCKNHCLMYLRKPKVNLSIDDDSEESEQLFMQIQSILHQEDSEIGKEEKLQSLEWALDQLKHQQKQCIELFYLKGKSYDEICKQTGYSQQEVKSFIQNGKRNLKISLMEKGITWISICMIWTHQFA